WRRGSLKLYKLVEEGFKSTNQHLSKMEKKLRIRSAIKSLLHHNLLSLLISHHRTHQQVDIQSSIHYCLRLRNC
ncbi:unnamed protein product, partial [Arabidopsis halleri]